MIRINPRGVTSGKGITANLGLNERMEENTLWLFNIAMEKSLINGGFNGNIIYKWVIYSIAMLNNQRVYIIMIYNILTTMVGGFKGALSENGVPQYWPRAYPCLSSFSHYINGIIYIYG